MGCHDDDDPTLFLHAKYDLLDNTNLALIKGCGRSSRKRISGSMTIASAIPCQATAFLRSKGY
jgi:hypothetical protein